MLNLSRIEHSVSLVKSRDQLDTPNGCATLTYELDGACSFRRCVVVNNTRNAKPQKVQSGCRFASLLGSVSSDAIEESPLKSACISLGDHSVRRKHIGVKHTVDNECPLYAQLRLLLPVCLRSVGGTTTPPLPTPLTPTESETSPRATCAEYWDWFAESVRGERWNGLLMFWYNALDCDCTESQLITILIRTVKHNTD